MEPPIFDPFTAEQQQSQQPINKNNTCQVYGDLRPYKPLATVTLVIDGVSKTIKVCDEHQAFFEDFDPVLYAIGFSFTGEVEIRPIPAQPTPLS